MQKLKRIIFRILIVSVVLIMVGIIVTSTTGFKIQKNPMENFFAQHKEIDSILINEKLSKGLVLEDIDFLIKTIEEVHPNPYCYISKEKIYLYRDSIKHSFEGDITRERFFHILCSLVKQIDNGHTQIKFPEISEGEDNKSNFDKAHENPKTVITYHFYNQNIGYLYIKDFVIEKHDFIEIIDSIFNQINHDSVKSLIIDIRNNPGGNSELADYLISCIYDKPYKGNSKIQIKRSAQYCKYLKGYFSWWFRPFLMFIKPIRDYNKTPVGEIYEDIKGFKNPINTPHKFSSKVYLLINGNTFSTALGFATIFKDYNLGIVVGEQTKAEVNEFGDIFPFDLPNCGLWVWCSAKRYIRPSGEMTIGGLKPDIFIEDKNDSILNHTIKIIKSE
jgi:hypothetical protein